MMISGVAINACQQQVKSSGPNARVSVADASRGSLQADESSVAASEDGTSSVAASDQPPPAAKASHRLQGSYMDRIEDHGPLHGHLLCSVALGARGRGAAVPHRYQGAKLS
jgi:hypothetical protein